jgi:hypothetical protein
MSITREEKIAERLITLLSDIRIDLTLVGYYFASIASKGAFLRLEEVLDSAEETIENAGDRNKHYQHMVTLGKD